MVITTFQHIAKLYKKLISHTYFFNYENETVSNDISRLSSLRNPKHNLCCYTVFLRSVITLRSTKCSHVLSPHPHLPDLVENDDGTITIDTPHATDPGFRMLLRILESQSNCSRIITRHNRHDCIGIFLFCRLALNATISLNPREMRIWIFPCLQWKKIVEDSSWVLIIQQHELLM